MEDLLKNLGANKKEAETFLKLLELGAQPVSVIARYMSVPRPTMYLILESLKKLGLVEEFERMAVKYFKCIPAKDIPGILEMKKDEIKRALDVLEDRLPELEALENKLSITPKVKFYEGKDAVTKMYEEVLNEKSFYACFNPQIDNPVMKIYSDKVGDTINERNLKVSELVVDGPKGKEYVKKYMTKNHKIKLLPKNMKFDSDNFICEDKIYMVSYGERDVSAVKIYSKSLAETQKAMFEQVWRSA